MSEFPRSVHRLETIGAWTVFAFRDAEHGVRLGVMAPHHLPTRLAVAMARQWIHTTSWSENNREKGRAELSDESLKIFRHWADRQQELVALGIAEFARLDQEASGNGGASSSDPPSRK